MASNLSTLLRPKTPEGYDYTFRSGLYCGYNLIIGWYATYPFAKIFLYKDRIEIQDMLFPMKLLKDEIERIHFQRSFFHAGLRIHHTNTKHKPVIIIGCREPKIRLGWLELLGYPTEPMQ